MVTPLVSAQIVGAYYPVEVGPPPTVVVGESYVVHRPVITYSQVVESPMVTAYRPVVTTHHPVVTSYRPVGPTVVYPRTVVVRPKVYVRGQPVRNVLRAITPWENGASKFHAYADLKLADLRSRDLALRRDKALRPRSAAAHRRAATGSAARSRHAAARSVT